MTYTDSACSVLLLLLQEVNTINRLLLSVRLHGIAIYGVGGGLPFIGVMSICLCGVAALSIRVGLVRLELEQRFAELRSKRGELARLQRNMAKLAELSVLEERSRIAHEIHDAVGHTLTAAIIQLEAMKKLTEQRSSVPWGKLELLDALMRKGLEDVRRAVQLMNASEAPTLPLEAKLRELIRYTEETMEIAVVTDIALSAKPELSGLTERLLYQALQEGLTNGVRHGRCSRAWFSLRASDGMLRFLLVNDGEPYGSAVPGFGLTSMAERARLLGGDVDIRPSVDDDGNPAGCELTIVLPLGG